MPIATHTATIQASVEALDALLAQVADQIAVLDNALRSRHDAVLTEFKSAGVPLPAIRSQTSGYDRVLARAVLDTAATPLLTFLGIVNGPRPLTTLAEFTEKLAALQSSTDARVAGGAV